MMISDSLREMLKLVLVFWGLLEKGNTVFYTLLSLSFYEMLA